MTNREIWLRYAEEQKSTLEPRIREGIEAHRKGYCKLRVTDADGNPVPHAKIEVHQTKHAFKHGANIFMLDEFPTEELNASYRELFKKYFNVATVPFYWDALEPEQGKPRFAKDSPKIYRRPAPELCVEYCEQNGIEPKLHCFIYEKFIPDWVPRNDMAAAEKFYEKRIREIAERYSGRMWEFEVMNELLCEKNWTVQTAISRKRDIIEWGFDLARKYLPNETLVINEACSLHNIAQRDYRDEYFMMIDAALKSGADIDKIGIQHHCFTGAKTTTNEEYLAEVARGSEYFNPMKILQGLDYLAEFGLPLELTEITVPTFGDTEEDELLQADLLDLLYSTCFAHPALDGLVYWNLPDDYAFAPANTLWNENICRGGLFHKDMTPKKSAERLYELFNKRWHTDLDLVADENGCVEFRGFYGDYTASANGGTWNFSLEKYRSNSIELR